MNDDPIIKEIRTYRRSHAASFNYDIRAIVKDLKDKGGKWKNPVVSFKPKLICRKTGT